MTDTWLDRLVLASRAVPVVRAVVIEVRGSAPREPGAWMIISEAESEGTIGGGAMEQAVLAAARAQLACGDAAPWWRREMYFHLGPDLNQCCGGAVRVLIEQFGATEAQALLALSARTIARPLQAGTPPRASTETILRATDGVLVEPIHAIRTQVYIYGAGHVGQALARALAPLPFDVTGLDGPRDASSLPAPHFESLSDERLLTRAAQAPAGAFHLVMTHSHALDEALVAMILHAGTAGYVGLIGSETKAARFRLRLARAGIGQKCLESLHCPIGLPGLHGKAPALIAASVAADLLLRRQQHPPTREPD